MPHWWGRSVRGTAHPVITLPVLVIIHPPVVGLGMHFYRVPHHPSGNSNGQIQLNCPNGPTMSQGIGGKRNFGPSEGLRYPLSSIPIVSTGANGGGIPTEPSFSILDLGKFCPLHMEYFMGAQTIGSQHRTHLTPLWMVYLFPPVRNFCVRVCSPADRWE